MNWTKNLPTEPGCYVFCGYQDNYHKSKTYLVAGYVEYGRWQYAENPQWLYFNGDLISSLVGSWYRLESPPPDKHSLVLSIDSGEPAYWTPTKEN